MVDDSQEVTLQTRVQFPFLTECIWYPDGIGSSSMPTHQRMQCLGMCDITPEFCKIGSAVIRCSIVPNGDCMDQEQFVSTH